MSGSGWNCPSDDEEKLYRITQWDGTVRELSEQELFDIFVYYKIDGVYDYHDLKSKIKIGQPFVTTEYEFDFDTGQQEPVGKMVFERLIKGVSKPPAIPCSHKNTYVNVAGGQKFRFCKDCKKDLGDVID